MQDFNLLCINHSPDFKSNLKVKFHCHLFCSVLAVGGVYVCMNTVVNEKLNARKLTNKLVMAVPFGKGNGTRVKGGS